jgi:hypothetical protein
VRSAPSRAEALAIEMAGGKTPCDEAAELRRTVHRWE